MTDFGNPSGDRQAIFRCLAGVLYDEIIGFQNTELSAALAMWMIVPALVDLLPARRHRPAQALPHGRRQRRRAARTARAGDRRAIFLITTVAGRQHRTDRHSLWHDRRRVFRQDMGHRQHLHPRPGTPPSEVSTGLHVRVGRRRGVVWNSLLVAAHRRPHRWLPGDWSSPTWSSGCAQKGAKLMSFLALLPAILARRHLRHWLHRRLQPAVRAKGSGA